MPSVHTNNGIGRVSVIPATNDLEHALGRSLNQERALWVVIVWVVVLGAVTDPDLVQFGLEPPDCTELEIRGRVYLQSQLAVGEKRSLESPNCLPPQCMKEVEGVAKSQACRIT